jgi:hypothetical protein
VSARAPNNGDCAGRSPAFRRTRGSERRPQRATGTMLVTISSRTVERARKATGRSSILAMKAAPSNDEVGHVQGTRWLDATWATVFYLCFAVSAAGLPEEENARVIAAARTCMANSIDASLPVRPLEAWLQDVVGRNCPLKWGIGCQEKGDAPEPDGGWPACAEARCATTGLEVVLALQVGFFKRGRLQLSKRAPTISDTSFVSAPLRTPRAYSFFCFRHPKRLSDLPRLLKEVRGCE